MATIIKARDHSRYQVKTRLFTKLARVLLLVPMLGLLSGPSLYAAVFDVPCGDVAALIAAITAANAKRQNDVINLAACTYTLTAVENHTDGPNGLPSIISRIKINGAGAAQTIITRNPAAAPFRLVHDARSGNLVLQGVSLTNGLLASGTGGGLFNAGALTLTSSTVQENSVVDLDDCIFCGTGPGGGIASSGRLTVVQTTVADNFSSSGGGIFNSGVLKMTGSTVTGNNTDDSSGAGTCAGIHTSGTATITSSTIREIAAPFWVEAYATPAESLCVTAQWLKIRCPTVAAPVWSTTELFPCATLSLPGTQAVLEAHRPALVR
jgi:hypothetical protein